MTPRVLILLSEDDPFPARQEYNLFRIAERWPREGIEVAVARGVDQATEADLVFPHVDRTVMPDDYRAYLDRCPRVVNRGVYDLSKRRISTLLTEPGDGWNGPVIVKTDLNYGGLMESDRERQARTGGLGPRLRRWVGRHRPPDLATTRWLLPSTYPVFDSIEQVPEGVFRNPALIVERFLPERVDGIYYMEQYSFLGDRSTTRRVGSRSPIIKGRVSVSTVYVEAHDDIVELRHRMGFDWGKFDYVVHEGRAVLLDANVTVGLSPPELIDRLADTLAPGIWSLLGPPNRGQVLSNG